MENDKIDSRKLPPNMELEQILIKEMGQFGKYQARLLCIIFTLSILVILSANEFVFTTARIKSRCLIPECEDVDSEFTPSWLLRAIPGTSFTSYDSCRRYEHSSSSSRNETSSNCPISMFNRSAIIKCERHLYENTDTIVYDFDLGCQEWYRSMIGSVRIVGAIMSLPMTGYFSDKYGRRIVIAVQSVNLFIFGIIRYWANSYFLFIFSHFFETLLSYGIFACSYVLLQELVGPKYRSITGAFISCTVGIANIFLGLVASYLPNWRHLTLAIHAPHVLVLPLYWLIPESIKWSLSKGQYDQALDTLTTISKYNGRVISNETIYTFKSLAIKEKESLTSIRDNTSLFVLVFRHKSILLRCIIGPILWITMTLTYYGLTLNAVNMSGRSYNNFMGVSAAEIPGFWVAFLLMNKLPRKVILTSAYWMCCTSMVIFIVTPSDQYWLCLMVFMFGKFSVAAVITTLYVYSTEIFPTSHRSTLFGFCSMIGSLGSLVAPLTPALGDKIWIHFPFVLFAVFCFMSGILIFFTPETKDIKLPDTMDEAEQMGKHKDIVTSTDLRF